MLWICSWACRIISHLNQDIMSQNSSFPLPLCDCVQVRLRTYLKTSSFNKWIFSFVGIFIVFVFSVLSLNEGSGGWNIDSVFVVFFFFCFLLCTPYFFVKLFHEHFMLRYYANVHQQRWEEAVKTCLLEQNCKTNTAAISKGIQTRCSSFFFFC